MNNAVWFIKGKGVGKKKMMVEPGHAHLKAKPGRKGVSKGEMRMTDSDSIQEQGHQGQGCSKRQDEDAGGEGRTSQNSSTRARALQRASWWWTMTKTSQSSSVKATTWQKATWWSWSTTRPTWSSTSRAKREKQQYNDEQAVHEQQGRHQRQDDCAHARGCSSPWGHEHWTRAAATAQVLGTLHELFPSNISSKSSWGAALQCPSSSRAAHVQNGKNLGYSGQEGFVDIPLSSELGPFSLVKHGFQFWTLVRVKGSKSLWPKFSPL